MSGNSVSLCVLSGESWSATVTWMVDSVPVDLAGYAVVFEVRQASGGGVVTGCTAVVSDAPGGVITIGIPSGVTEVLSGAYRFRVLATAPDDSVSVPVFGRLRVVQT